MAGAGSAAMDDVTRTGPLGVAEAGSSAVGEVTRAGSPERTVPALLAAAAANSGLRTDTALRKCACRP